VVEETTTVEPPEEVGTNGEAVVVVVVVVVVLVVVVGIVEVVPDSAVSIETAINANNIKKSRESSPKARSWLAGAMTGRRGN
jgi:hypothetical protein